MSVPDCPVKIAPSWKYPLYALAIISIGPSVITPFLYVALRLLGVTICHCEIAFDVEFLLVFPVMFSIANWPFLVLFRISKWKAKREWPSIRSVRLAMWCSLIAMSQEMLSQVYKGTEYALFFLQLVQSPLGLIGWFLGRDIAFVSHAIRR
jgi:hypothetical protein